VFDDVRVAMEPSPAVTVRCPQVVDLPAGITAVLHWNLVEKGIQAAVLGHGLPTQLTAGAGAMRGETPLPIRAELDLYKGQNVSESIALLPASIDPETLVDGQTIELSGDDAALQRAIQKLSKR
jgi:hypothetical protein